jgi:hypothetical protein
MILPDFFLCLLLFRFFGFSGNIFEIKNSKSYYGQVLSLRAHREVKCGITSKDNLKARVKKSEETQKFLVHAGRYIIRLR